MCVLNGAKLGVDGWDWGAEAWSTGWAPQGGCLPSDLEQGFWVLGNCPLCFLLPRAPALGSGLQGQTMGVLGGWRGGFGCVLGFHSPELLLLLLLCAGGDRPVRSLQGRRSRHSQETGVGRCGPRAGDDCGVPAVKWWFPGRGPALGGQSVCRGKNLGVANLLKRGMAGDERGWKGCSPGLLRELLLVSRGWLLGLPASPRALG